MSGGTRPSAWVGFGTNDVGDSEPSRRIEAISARSSSGAVLPVVALGPEAYRVEVGASDPWTLEYELVTVRLPGDFYHRASSRSDQHLLLIGADAFARFYMERAPLTLELIDRPPGAAAAASVTFDPGAIPDGWRVVSAAPEQALNRFALDDAPALSSFAVGPYRVDVVDREVGLSMAVHRDWTLARRSLMNHARQLLRVMLDELGPPPGDSALMIMTPFPPESRPLEGVRTAGMVWNRTLNLFAGTAGGLPQDNRLIREMLAIFLGHEMFHLYVPWGITVVPELSWLSEGWASHMARTTAAAARLLSRAGADESLRKAFERYAELGGARAGSLQEASEAGEASRELLYVRGELVFRVLSLEWADGNHPESFDRALWTRLAAAHDGEHPLAPAAVTSTLSEMVSPTTVRLFVDGSAPITLAQLQLGRR